MLFFRQSISAIVLLSAILFQAAISLADDHRVNWFYETEFGERRFEFVGDAEWGQVFANGERFACEEIARTDEYIEVKNTENGNVFRLLVDHGTRQKRGNAVFV